MAIVETAKEETMSAEAGRKDALTIKDERTGRVYEVPIKNGTIKAMDLRQIKTDPQDFGLMAYDPAFLNTASCTSRITYIDGDKGILRYRGYPIDVLAEKCTYLEVAFLLLYGELPDRKQYDEWVHAITYHTMIHESLKKVMDAFNYDAHPMGMLIATVAARGPLTVVVHQGPADRAAVEALLARLDRPVERLVEPELPALAAALASARAYLGGDSGISHLAAAVGAPSVILFPPAHLPRWTPWSPAARPVATTGAGDEVPGVVAALELALSSASR